MPICQVYPVCLVHMQANSKPDLPIHFNEYTIDCIITYYKDAISTAMLPTSSCQCYTASQYPRAYTAKRTDTCSNLLLNCYASCSISHVLRQLGWVGCRTLWILALPLEVKKHILESSFHGTFLLSFGRSDNKNCDLNRSHQTVKETCVHTDTQDKYRNPSAHARQGLTV